MDDLGGLGVEHAVEDLLAVAFPALDPVDVVPAQPVVVGPRAATVRAGTSATKGTWSLDSEVASVGMPAQDGRELESAWPAEADLRRRTAARRGGWR